MLNMLLTTLLAVRFDPMQFVYSLKYMAMGMLCIIIVMAVLIAVTVVLNKLAIKFSKKDDDSDE